MKINELSNPTSTHSDFILVGQYASTREYKNSNTEKLLICKYENDSYLFSYDGTIVQRNLGSKIALAIFKTVLYDIKKYVIDKNERCIYFSADIYESSRVKLYNTLAKMLIKFGYNRIENSKDCEYYFEDPIDFIHMLYDNDSIYYIFAKKDSSTIPLTELRNPSKPSDKFKLTYSHEFANLSQYTYYSTNTDRHGDNYILDLTFLGSDNTEIYFDLNGTQAQSPEYAHMAMAVFQTVIHKINEYVKKHNPKTIKFSSSIAEPSRIKLYHRICNYIPGYEMTEIDGYFQLTKQ